MSLDAIRNALADFTYLTQAVVFGSVATGRASDESDIDIGVQADAPLRTEQHIAITDALTLATGRTVDLVDLSQAGIPLLGEILRDGIRLFGSNEVWAALALRNITLNEDLLPCIHPGLEARNRTWLR